jgi:hypothetical protein
VRELAIGSRVVQIKDFRKLLELTKKKLTTEEINNKL